LYAGEGLVNVAGDIASKGAGIAADVKDTITEIPTTISSGAFSQYLGSEALGAGDVLSFGLLSDLLDVQCHGRGYGVGELLGLTAVGGAGVLTLGPGAVAVLTDTGTQMTVAAAADVVRGRALYEAQRLATRYPKLVGGVRIAYEAVQLIGRLIGSRGH
jgi:hypothetical protein